MRRLVLPTIGLLICAAAARPDPAPDLERELMALRSELRVPTEPDPAGAVLRIYEVADLTPAIRAHRCPNMHLKPAGSKFDEDWPVFGRWEVGPGEVAGEELADLLRDFVRPEAWLMTDHSVMAIGRQLHVFAPPDLQAEVRGALRTLRAVRNRMVTVEVRFVRLAPGRRPAGVLAPAEFDALLDHLRRGEGGEILAAAEFTALPGQRAALFAGRQRAFVQDYDMEVSGSAKIQDPIVGVLLSGLSFDVAATIAGQELTLEYLLGHARDGDPGPHIATTVGPVAAPSGAVVVARGTVSVPERGGAVLLAEGTGDGEAFLLRACSSAVGTTMETEEDRGTREMREEIALLRRLVAARKRGPGRVLRTLSVADLLGKRMDLEAPPLDLVASGCGGFGDDRRSDFSAGWRETFEGDELLALIRDRVPTDFAEEPMDTEVRLLGTELIVRHAPEGQIRIADLLSRLRRHVSRSVEIEIQAMALSERDRSALLGEESFPVLSPPALDRLREWIASGRAVRLAAERVSARSGRQIAISDLAHRSYVHDVDVEIGGPAIGDPLLAVVAQGLAAEIRPVVTGDGSHVLLECRLGRSRLAPGDHPRCETPVGTIETPTISLTTVGTTVLVRDGATVCVGGGLRVSGPDDVLGPVIFLLTPRVRATAGR